MLKQIKSTGKNEETTIRTALQKLGMDRDRVFMEILERAKPGFLGIGSCPVKVKMSHKAPDEPEEHLAPMKVTPVGAEPVKATEHVAQEEAPPSPAAPVAEGEKAERIDVFLTDLLAQTGVEARLVARMDENGTCQVELVGQEPGGLISRRGETLDIIQQLTGYAVNHGWSKRVRIHMGAEGYRTKREESLVRLTQKVADRVVKYHRNVTLEPMNAYEHHMIHTTLQEALGATTYSIDTEPNRCMVVAYSRGEHR